MQFYFIRHAQSNNNALYQATQSDIGRTEDPDLTELGLRQADCLADYLCSGPAGGGQVYPPDTVGGFGITHLYSSLMLRSVKTGSIVAQKLGLPLVGWIDLHEEGGIYLDDENGNPIGRPGKNDVYFARHYPRLLVPSCVGGDGWWNRPFESSEERPLRAQRVVKELLEKHGNTEHRVAVISHGGFYNHFLRALANISSDSKAWFSIFNTGITRIDFHDHTADIIYTNRMDFLPKSFIT